MFLPVPCIFVIFTILELPTQLFEFLYGLVANSKSIPSLFYYFYPLSYLGYLFFVCIFSLIHFSAIPLQTAT